MDFYVLDFDILIEPDMAARCETALLLSGDGGRHRRDFWDAPRLDCILCIVQIKPSVHSHLTIHGKLEESKTRTES